MLFQGNIWVISVKYLGYFREISDAFQGVWGMLLAGVAGANFRELPKVSKKMTNLPDFTRIFDTRYPVFYLIGQIYMIAGLTYQN